MSWQEDHKKRVEGFPADVRDAHAHSIHHRSALAESTLCGCFYCLATFPPGEIVEWIDEENPDGEGRTALCPRCGVDSVIGDKSGFDISKQFLVRMRSYWF
jgi:hypothetical protein